MHLLRELTGLGFPMGTVLSGIQGSIPRIIVKILEITLFDVHYQLTCEGEAVNQRRINIRLVISLMVLLQ